MKEEVVLHISFNRMRNETVVRLGSDIYRIAGRIGPGAIGIKTLYDELGEILVAMNVSLDQVTKSVLTAGIEDQDHFRGEMAHCLSTTTRAFLHHPDPAKRAAAERLEIVLDRYGNIAQKTYDDASSAVDDLVKELYTPVNAPLVILLGVGEWVTLLSNANAKFVDLMDERYKESGQRHVSMKEARVPLEEKIHKIERRVNSIIELNGIDFSPELTEFVQEYNAVARRYKHILAQEQGRRNAHRDDSDENPEEDQ